MNHLGRLRHGQAAMNQLAAAGGIDQVVAWDGSRLLATPFYARHRDLLDRARGGGYWLWKPYIILKAIRQANEDDRVID